MLEGSLIAGRFKLIRLAGSGGMGSVYEARDQQSGAPVAVKLLRWHNDALVGQLLREAQLLADLDHPGIVRYLSHGVNALGEPFLVMEWLEGETLADRLLRGPLDVRAAVALVADACDTLAAVHRHGLVHRDIKPQNLFLPSAPNARAKLVDFGIARREIAHETGRLAGTPAFMAPEQARGDREIDQRADVFALGCLTFACLTQRSPFAGHHPEAALARVLFEEAPRLRDLGVDAPPLLEDLVDTMLVKEADGRPDAAGVAAALAELVRREGDTPDEAPPARALGWGEQRVLCVVLIAPPRAPDEEQLAPVAAEHGGRLEILADGSVAVIFSTSGHSADPLIRAARGAFALRRLCPGAAMVLTTGRGRIDGWSPMGAVIDRAGALLHEAPAGDERIWIDEVSAAGLESRFAIGGDGARRWLAGERAGAAGPRRLLGRTTPCVGRDRELTLLEASFDECAGEPLARALLITAAPGIGKSRLRHEFLSRLERRGVDCAVWTGAGDPMRAGSPYALLADALRGPLGLHAGDADPAAVLRRRVAGLVPAADAERVSEFLGELCGVVSPGEGTVQQRAARMDPVLMGDQVRRAWLDLVAAELERRPLVLVLEDLHWGDLPSINLVDAALRNLAGRPLLVVALARPEVHTLFSTLWAERRVDEIRLRELTRGSSEKLVRQALAGQALDEQALAEQAARIADRSRGNPFFIEELIRAVDERTDELPDTVLAMLDTRLAQLPDQLRHALRAASVFGEAFWEEGVTALLGDEPRATVRQRLAELTAREWIQPRGESRFAGQREHAFAHGLLRDAVYATLTDADRQEGHRLAADWLEATGERAPLVLAEHHRRGGDPARAAGWYEKAAREALQGNDFAGALAHVESAVQQGAAGAQLGALRLVQAEAHSWRGEPDLAGADAAQALRLLPPGGAAWAGAVHFAAWAAGALGRHDELSALAAQLAGRLDGEASAAHLVTACATAIKLLEAGRADEGNALLARVESARGDAVVAAWLADARAFRAQVAGNPDELLRFLRESEAAWTAMGDQRHVCIAQINIGYACLELGGYEESQRELRAALAAAERLGLEAFLLGTRQNLGLALALGGALAEARAVEDAAAAGFAARGDRRMEGISRLYLALIDTLPGDTRLEVALRHCDRAIELLDAVPGWRAYAVAVRARALLARGEVAPALAAASEAMAAVDALGGIEEGEATVRLAHAEALFAAGEAQRARAAIAVARDRLLARASRIADPLWRRSFLERPRENARTVALAAEWLTE